MINYEKYKDESTTLAVTPKEYFSDSDGFPNDKAFWDFAKNLTADDKMYLLCLDIDLTPSNKKKGLAFANLVLRKFFISMAYYFPSFRMRGSKFNLFIPEDKLDLVDEMFETDNTALFTLHGEVVKNEYVHAGNVKAIIGEGVRRMVGADKYSDNPKKKKVVKNPDAIVGELLNVPPELQETSTRKYISTMWFAKITFRETKPAVRTLTAYVFPTEYKPPMALLETFVVLDDMVTTKVYSGTAVQMPIDGMRISITTRFDNDGNFVVSWFKAGDSADGIIEGEMEVHESEYIPTSFGKRIGKGIEVYPIKKNNQGLFEYVKVDKNPDAPKRYEYISSGIIQGKENEYEVHKDSKFIELVKSEKM